MYHSRFRVLSLSLALLFLLPVLALGDGPLFSDVSEEDWFSADVALAVAGGHMVGYGDGRFGPHESLTNAEAVKLAATLHATAVTGAADFPATDPWMAAYVAYAGEVGILTGELSWDEPATRQDFMALFSRAIPGDATHLAPLAAQNEVAAGAFTDVDEAHPLYGEMMALVAAGIVTGDDTGALNPGDTIRRAEVAAMVGRMVHPELRVHRNYAPQPQEPLTVALSPESLRAQPMSILKVAAQVSGGEAPYHYQWFSADEAGTLTDISTYLPYFPGGERAEIASNAHGTIHGFQVVVTDAGGRTATSPLLGVTYAPPRGEAIAKSRGAERVAQIKKFQAAYNIPITGGINAVTREMLDNPRLVPVDEVDAPPTQGLWIAINKSTRILTLYRGGEVVSKHPVALGASRSTTPSVQSRIINKAVNPAWKHMSGNNPANPLGERWMGFHVPGRSGFGIHGTIRPDQIGQYASHGCVRMFNYDVENFVYPHMKVGDPVWVGTADQLTLGRPPVLPVHGVGSRQRPSPLPGPLAPIPPCPPIPPVAPQAPSSGALFHFRPPRPGFGRLPTKLGHHTHLYAAAPRTRPRRTNWPVGASASPTSTWSSVPGSVPHLSWGPWFPYRKARQNLQQHPRPRAPGPFFTSASQDPDLGGHQQTSATTPKWNLRPHEPGPGGPTGPLGRPPVLPVPGIASPAGSLSSPGALGSHTAMPAKISRSTPGPEIRGHFPFPIEKWHFGPMSCNCNFTWAFS